MTPQPATSPQGVGPPGPVLFGRYAFGPNRLGYCGPDDSRALLDLAATGTDERSLRDVAGQFDGAYPYLRLIAAANGVADPLDARVVEAYWLGNSLSAAVRPRDLHRSVRDRFRPRLAPGAWHRLEESVARGARPVHAFHVFDVFPRVGMLRGGAVDNLLSTLDACRIRWGRVESVSGDRLLVSTSPLAMVDGRLRLGAPRLETVTRWLDGTGFVNDLQPGETIAIHWSWACDRLGPRQLRNLVAWTRLALRVANRPARPPMPA